MILSLRIVTKSFKWSSVKTIFPINDKILSKWGVISEVSAAELEQLRKDHNMDTECDNMPVMIRGPSHLLDDDEQSMKLDDKPILVPVPILV
jgi:hypothetical protein